VCLVARHLEAHGIPTLVLGSAFDIISAGAPPRAVFLDYPLGHSAGKPQDPADQDAVLRAALTAFDKLSVPGDLVTLSNVWGDNAWREEAGSTEARDTRQPRDETPQWQLPEDRDAALAAGLTV
jgi:hypothetical protein